MEIMHPFPIKIMDGNWQVQMDRPSRWIKCDNWNDANKISRSQLVVNQAACGHSNGEQFSTELEASAKVLDRYEMAGGAGLPILCCRQHGFA